MKPISHYLHQGSASESAGAHASLSRNTLIVIIGAILLGSVLVVVNSEDLYLLNRNSATVSVPDRLLSGGGGSLLIMATDADGGPAADREVSVTLTRGQESHLLWKGKTDGDGIVQPRFEVPGTPGILGKGELTVTVGSESLTRTVEIVSTYRIILSTDKPLYQPGQTIHLRTLTYEGSDPRASEENVTIEIRDPDGNRIFRRVIGANEYGIASLDLELSDQLPLGNYEITASIGEASSMRTVSIQRYVLPKYSIRFQGLESWYVAGDTIQGTLNASYVFGEPIRGQAVIHARTYYGEWETIRTFEGQLEDGLLNFTLPLASAYFVGLDINSGNAYLELNATITDTSGHTEQRSHMVTITESPISILSVGDTNVHGQDSTYHFIARFPDGTPAAGASFTMDLNGYGLGPYHGGSYPGPTRSVLTADDRGVASFTFLYDRNITSLKVVAQSGEYRSLDYYVNLRGAMEGLKVVPDRGGYALGERASFTVHYAGSAGGTNLVFYDIVANGFVVGSGRVELENGQAAVDLTVTHDMVPMVECRVFKIQGDLSVLRDSAVITVGGDEALDVTISTERSTYRPGDDLFVDFLVEGPGGNGLPSALGITIVDLSVFELKERFTGYQDIYFSLESEFTEPSYQILQYAYGTGNTLPPDTTSHVDMALIETGVVVYQSGEFHRQDAERFGEDTSDRVTDLVLVMALLGYLSLFLLAAKYPVNRRIFLSVIIALTLFIPVALLHSPFMMDKDGDDDDAEWQRMGPGFGEPAGFGGDMWFDDMEFGAGGAPVMDADGAAPRELNGGDAPPSAPGKTVREPDHVRKEFPETWVWQPSLITDENGRARLGLVAPDTITTWRVDALASTMDARMGVGTGTITVFQEFFIEPDIPVEVVRNDEFPLNIMVYNYHSEEQEITLRLGDEPWFELLPEAGPEDPDEPDEPDAPGTRGDNGNGDDPQEFYRVVTVAPASVVGVEYRIRAREVGEHTITVTGSSDRVDDLVDQVIRPVRVVPDGRLVRHIINGELTDAMTVNHEIDLDPDRIPGSENAYLTLQGSMGAVTIEGAEKYIGFVSGCGEQSMSRLSINVLAYGVVKENGAPGKLFEYEMMCTQGIQHQLTFLMRARDGEGRGIVWFPSDEDVHPWLTSWGLITFQDAVDAGFAIDPAIMADMQAYLLSQQNSDGSFTFPERGLYEFTNPILRAKVVSTTAYITRALIYSGHPVDSRIRSAVQYIEDNVRDHWDDPYTLALSLIVLKDAGGKASLANAIATRLLELKQDDGDTSFWTSETNMIGSSREMWWGGSSSNTIETTSYAIMALARQGYPREAARGIKYLLTNRIGGGFFSTQDTVVAFQALTSWGEVDVEHLELATTMNGVEVDSRVIHRTNSDLTYLIDLREPLQGSNTITITSSGNGSILYQIVIEEYVPWDGTGSGEDKELHLQVEYDTTNVSVNDAITATLSVSYTGHAPQIKMVLVDIRAPVGFSFDGEELAALVESNPAVSNVELTGRQCMLYLTDLVSGEEYRFQYSLRADKPIRATLQGVNAYDMYNPFLRDEAGSVEITSFA